MGAATAALLVVVVVLAASLAYVVVTPQSVTRTSTQTVTRGSTATQTSTVTIIVNQSSRTTLETTSCAVSGPTIGVMLRVLEDASHPTPVAGAQITGQMVGWCNDAQQVSLLQPETTNSSGWASLLDGGFGIYDLSINYSSDHYSLSIATLPMTLTCVVYNTTSGNVTTTLSEYESRCPAGP